MRVVWRALVVLATFVLVGYGTMRWLIERAVARGTPEYSVRLGGAMGGLFVGGAAAVLAGIGLFVAGKRPSPDSDEPPQ